MMFKTEYFILYTEFYIILYAQNNCLGHLLASQAKLILAYWLLLASNSYN